MNIYIFCKMTQNSFKDSTGFSIELIYIKGFFGSVLFVSTVVYIAIFLKEMCSVIYTEIRTS